jgi:hypothetical protein
MIPGPAERAWNTYVRCQRELRLMGYDQARVAMQAIEGSLLQALRVELEKDHRPVPSWVR